MRYSLALCLVKVPLLPSSLLANWSTLQLRNHSTFLPWELRYTDNLVLNVDAQEGCISKVKAWKAGMESKGLPVNMMKTEFLANGDEQDVL